MGSVANTDVTLPDAVVPKRESSVDRYSSFSVSTPDEEDGVGAGEEQLPLEPAPAPKRKGGRKPVCQLDCLGLNSQLNHTDLCDIRRTQAEKSSGTSGVS